jgi:hypothetical protein
VAGVLGRHPRPLWSATLLGPLARVIRAGVVIGMGATVGGCVPTVSGYLKIEAPEARYLETSCNAGIGLPSIVYYPYHGVFISLDITTWVAFGVHVPAGNTVRLEGNRVRISGTSRQGLVDVRMPIWAGRQGSVGAVLPPEFRGLPDPFTSRDFFGPLQGASRDGHNLWYFFLAETGAGEGQIRTISAPRGLQRGSVELPPMTINGQHYDAQTLQFERHVHLELIPVNC